MCIVQLIADSYATLSQGEQQVRRLFPTMILSTWAEFIQPVCWRECLQIQTQTGICYAILRAEQSVQIPAARPLRSTEFIDLRGVPVCKYLKA